jgi:hypothetical protein
VESAHNMTRMSAGMSWMDGFRDAGDGVELVICSSMRRACIYPYMRSWKLARKVLADVARVLFLGKHCILKCLLGLRSVIEHTDTHYMLNKVIIDDYCVWLQIVDAKLLADLATEFNAAKTQFEKGAHVGKAAVGLQLPELEHWLEAEGFNSDGDEQSIPDTFNTMSRNAATASTVLHSKPFVGSADHFASKLVVGGDMSVSAPSPSPSRSSRNESLTSLLTALKVTERSESDDAQLSAVTTSGSAGSAGAGTTAMTASPLLSASSVSAQSAPKPPKKALIQVIE